MIRSSLWGRISPGTGIVLALAALGILGLNTSKRGPYLFQVRPDGPWNYEYLYGYFRGFPLQYELADHETALFEMHDVPGRKKAPRWDELSWAWWAPRMPAWKAIAFSANVILGVAALAVLCWISEQVIRRHRRRRAPQDPSVPSEPNPGARSGVEDQLLRKWVPRIRFSLLTSIILTLAAGGILWLNTRERGPFLLGTLLGRSSDLTYDYGWMRGWPLQYEITKERRVVPGRDYPWQYSLAGEQAITNREAPPPLHGLSWPFCFGRPTGIVWKAIPIAVNSLVGLGALVLLGCVSEFLVRRHRRSTQQSLASVSPAESAHSDSEQVPSDRRGK
jgi:hypothetical protein